MQTNKCPQCPNTYALDPTIRGKRVKCNRCGHVFRAISDDTDAPAAQQSSNPTPLNPDPDELPPTQPGAKPAYSRRPITSPTGPNRTERSFAIALIATILAILGLSTWLARSERRAAQEHDHAVEQAHRALREQLAHNADVQHEIFSEGRRYIELRKLHLSLLRANRERLAEAAINQRLDAFRALKHHEHNERPSRPRIIFGNATERNNVIKYEDRLREWSERRSLLRLRHREAENACLELFGAYYTNDDLETHRLIMAPAEWPWFDKPPVLNEETARLVLYIEQLDSNAAAIVRRQYEQRLDELRALLRTGAASISQDDNDDTTTYLQHGTWTVVRVIDGDTIEARPFYAAEDMYSQRPAEKMRLLNINTPEQHAHGFEAATIALRSFVENRIVSVEYETGDRVTRDRYGRLLVFVFTINEGKFVNYEMIRGGWSRFYDEYGEGRYAAPLKYAEQLSRDGR